MAYIIVGLGNPGAEYEGTRHNVGRALVEKFAEKNDGEFKMNSARMALVSQIEVEGEKITCVLPETFMNRSGKSVLKDVKGNKKYDKLIVVHDDIDLPLGKVKLSFGKSSGGHKGVDSIMKALKSKDFPRLRIGISGETAKGVARKPKGEEAVIKHVLGKFSPKDREEFKKVEKRAMEAFALIVEKGYSIAMNEVNSK